MVICHPRVTAEINKQYPTLLSPNAILLGLYWIVVYALQIGFCLILVTARKDETKVGQVWPGLCR